MTPEDQITIRPAGRHIITIGHDLIQDQHAAIVELVKNAYDADSPNVDISFTISEDGQSITITIQDYGHGMSRDTVINKWLVPSTDDKIQRRKSPSGRVMQGRKGIGRYAAALLGNNLLLDTVTSSGEKTVVLLNWSDFQEAEYLDNVVIPVETEYTNDPSGTTLTIEGNIDHINQWTKKQIQKLQFELKKLVPPILFDNNRDVNNFIIYLNFNNFKDIDNGKIKIEPYAIFELHDYRIYGKINENGTGNLTFVNQKARNTIIEHMPFNLPGSDTTGCGELIIDIRVYDREKEAIDELIQRGLKDDIGNYVDKNQARRLLNDYNGVGVYRNGFRIRPLGDPEFDWLTLNEKRIQNPSMRIGSNQVIGYVQIQSEELSGLEEKSARDGLRENRAYKQLQKITGMVINKLEEKRFDYRRKAGLSRTTLKVERDLEKIIDFDVLKHRIRSKLLTKGIDEETATEVISLISDREEEASRVVNGIRQVVAVYQGQATLGKIINVVLHEGRRPLNYFTNQVPNITYWADELKKGYNPEYVESIISIAHDLGINAKMFVDLFSRLDPLAAGKRGPKRDYNLSSVLQKSFHVFENELLRNNISFNVDCNKSITLNGWRQDIYIIMTNLIDNSIYWMHEKGTKNKSIHIIVYDDDGKVSHIDYRDTGPGIETHLIESHVIFEPEFTTKSEGTGLGLAIAGEAATRNGFELKAFESSDGAYFRLQREDKEDNP